MGKTKKDFICNTLRAEIESGKFSATGDFPSDRALMRRFCVARETVRASLRELETKKLIRRAVGSGTKVVAERTRSHRFGLVLADMSRPFYLRIAAGIEEALKSRWAGGAANVLLTASLHGGMGDERIEETRRFARMCVRESVDGVFFQPLHFVRDGGRLNRELLGVFDGTGIPVVLLDSDFVAPPARSNYDLVCTDSTLVGYELARLMIARGARRIVFATHPLSAPTSLLRGIGMGMAASEAGLGWDDGSLVFIDDPKDPRAVKALFARRPRPDAVLCCDDVFATDLLESLHAIGLAVPDDLLVAGVNGDSVAAVASPPITTFVQPCRAMGRTAARMMFERLADPSLPPRETRIAAELVERESTMPKKRRANGRRAGTTQPPTPKHKEKP